MAIALERYLVPGVVSDPEVAYAEAMLRVCTSLTKGWFRQFAVDHWPQVRESLSLSESVLLCLTLVAQVCKLDRDLLGIVREHAEPIRALRATQRAEAHAERAAAAAADVAQAVAAAAPAAQLHPSLEPARRTY
jgi:hypothetical protein